MGLALQGPVCDKKEIDLRQLKGGGGITVDKMKEAQHELSKVLTPEQTQRGMIILRGLRADATEKERQAAVVSLAKHWQFFPAISFRIFCLFHL